MSRILSCALLLIFALTPRAHAFAVPGHGGHSHRSSSAPKKVHVRSYTRKDGTVVAQHERAARRTATTSGHVGYTSTRPMTSRRLDSPLHHPSTTSFRRNYLAQGFRAHGTVRLDRHGKIKRSAAVKDAFKRQHPCPANGNTRGRCPGYVIDHMNPLECGGADAPSNMQWQTVADGKAKDRTEIVPSVTSTPDGGIRHLSRQVSEFPETMEKL
jgi:hypothetical protein